MAASSGLQAVLALEALLVDSAPLDLACLLLALSLGGGSGQRSFSREKVPLVVSWATHHCPQQVKSQDVFWEKQQLGPEIGPCLGGAQHCPLRQPSPRTLPACALLFLQADALPSAASFCHSLCLLLERSDLSRMWKGPRGQRAGWGSRGGHVRGYCMGFFFFSLSLLML